MNPTTHTSVVQVHQSNGWYSVTFYGHVRASDLPSESAARLHVGLLEAIYAADVAVADHEVYGTTAAIEAAIAGRVCDEPYVTRPAALCRHDGWQLPHFGYAAILHADTIELWRIERGRFDALVCVYRERRTPPAIDRVQAQRLRLSGLVAFAQYLARVQAWDVETAYVYLHFFVEPFGGDVLPSADGTDAIWWHAGEAQAMRPIAERDLLRQSALNWFHAEYPDRYADALARLITSELEAA